MKVQHREQHLRKNSQDKQQADQIITRTNEIGDKYTRRTITASLQSTRTLKRLQRSQPSNKVTRTGKNTSTDTHPRHKQPNLPPSSKPPHPSTDKHNSVQTTNTSQKNNNIPSHIKNTTPTNSKSPRYQPLPHSSNQNHRPQHINQCPQNTPYSIHDNHNPPQPPSKNIITN